MEELNACPFCRELYSASEATVCPACDIPLRPLSELPPSPEVRDQEVFELLGQHPADRVFPVGYLGRGRGLLAALAILGLGLFFAPWLEVSMPYVATLSGWDLVRKRGFWFAGGAVSWGVLIPLIASRRTISSMLGVRAIAATLAAVTLTQAGLLWLRPPVAALVRLEFEWGWGMGVSALVSLIAVLCAIRWGGDPTSLPASFCVPDRELPKETSAGKTLH